MLYHLALGVLPANSPNRELIERLDYLLNPTEFANNIIVNVGTIGIIFLGRAVLTLALDGFSGITKVNKTFLFVLCIWKV